MNLFLLDMDHTRNARQYVDSHVVKMPTEYMQMMSLALQAHPNRKKGVGNASMGKSHANHPQSIWVRESLDNWLFMRNLVDALYDEYHFRYGDKVHRGCTRALGLPKPDLPKRGLTPFRLTMPKAYHEEDPVEAYKVFYATDKHHLHVWRGRQTPDWIPNYAWHGLFKAAGYIKST